jgi:hydrogenase maturation protease
MAMSQGTLVLGLGRAEKGDDGIGALAVARLREEWLVDRDVELTDATVLGPSLGMRLRHARRLLLVGPIDVGMRPGTEIVLGRDEIGPWLLDLARRAIDPAAEELAVAGWLGALPEETVAIGLQPAQHDAERPIAWDVARHVEPLAATIGFQLALWGHACESRFTRPPRS